jgi:hypothetical protein
MYVRSRTPNLLRCVCKTHTHTPGNDNCARLCYYAASSGNSLPTFRDKLSFRLSRELTLHLGFLTLEDGLDSLSPNVGEELPLFAG